MLPGLWRWKRSRDLKFDADKQRQQHAIAEELARKKQAAEDAARQLALGQELEAHLQRFASAGSPGNPDRVQDAFDGWVTWLDKNGLKYLPDNQKILDKWAIHNFRQANSQQTAAQLAKEVAADIKGTQLSSRP